MMGYPRLTVMGFSEVHNLGDQMCGERLRFTLGRLEPPPEVTWVSPGLHGNLVPGHLAAPSGDWLAAALCSDLVLLWGGSVVMPGWGIWRDPRWFRALQERSVPLVIWGGVQFETHRIGGAVAEVLSGAQHVFTRFESDVPVLEEIVGEPFGAQVGGDPLWCHPIYAERRAGTVVCLRSEALPLHDWPCGFVDALTSRLKGDVYLGAPDGDHIECPDGWAPVTTTYPLVAASCAVRHMISDRLHPVLLHLGQGRPAVGIETGGNKVTRLFEEVRLPELCVSPPNLSADAVLALLERVEADYELLSERLRDRVAELRRRTVRTFERLGNLVRGG